MNMSKEIIEEYDKNNNQIYYKDSDGFERWYKYDENNNEVYYKSSSGFERWMEYDKNNNRVYFKDTENNEEWKKYDENNREIYYKDSNNGKEKWYKYTKLGYKIEYTPETVCTKFTRFEIMEI